jgi:hypothetical protein
LSGWQYYPNVVDGESSAIGDNKGGL